MMRRSKVTQAAASRPGIMNNIDESSFEMLIGRIGENFSSLTKLELDMVSKIKYSFPIKNGEKHSNDNQILAANAFLQPFEHLHVLTPAAHCL
ncbi:MAG: hypothetical protein NTV58_07925 [Deltaproteobacteria bacterium]|nr:hypothetical protein [Deltaproteobacteria bacterium]